MWFIVDEFVHRWDWFKCCLSLLMLCIESYNGKRIRISVSSCPWPRYCVCDCWWILAVIIYREIKCLIFVLFHQLCSLNALSSSKQPCIQLFAIIVGICYWFDCRCICVFNKRKCAWFGERHRTSFQYRVQSVLKFRWDDDWWEVEWILCKLYLNILMELGFIIVIWLCWYHGQFIISIGSW